MSLFLTIAITTVVGVAAAIGIGLRASGGEPTFRVTAYRGEDWARVTRSVIASSASEAMHVVESQGLTPHTATRVWPVGRFLRRGVHVSDFYRRIPQRQMAEMADDVATLLENNISIQDAIPLYARQQPDNKCREVLRRINFEITSGNMSPEEAFAAHADQFGHEIATMIGVGTRSDVGIEGTFRNIARMCERRSELARGIKRAVIEPVMIGATILALLLYMTFYVLPQFAHFYQSYGSHLPGITQITLAVTSFATRDLWVLVLAGGALCGGLFLLRRNPTSRLVWDRTTLRIPVYGRIAQASCLGRVMGTVAAMLPVGVPIQVALPESIPTAKNAWVEKVLLDVSSEIGDASFSEAVHRHAHQLPDRLVAFVQTGAAAGADDEVLERYARITNRDVDLAAESLQSVLKTTLILLVGLPAAWIFAAMWFPMIFYIRLIH